LKSEEAKTALRDSQMRINSMGLIHEKLYQNENLSDVDFGQYIGELVDVIVRSQNKMDKDVHVVMETSPVKLPIKKSIPCGLVINEIVTNSLKYAFPEDHSDPEIRIKLKSENNHTTIEISDNGIGLPVPFEELNTDSLGTLLIKTLTSQLDADLNVESGDSGTKFTISFSLNPD
jgi:two-component sensor histidine kinase